MTINGNFVSHVGFVAGKGDDIITLSSPGFDQSNPSTGIVANISVTYTGGHDVINNANLLQTLFAPAPVSTTAVSGGTLLTFADGGRWFWEARRGICPISFFMAIRRREHGAAMFSPPPPTGRRSTPSAATTSSLRGRDTASFTADRATTVIRQRRGGAFCGIDELPGTADGINRTELTDVSSSALTAAL